MGESADKKPMGIKIGTVEKDLKPPGLPTAAVGRAQGQGYLGMGRFEDMNHRGMFKFRSMLHWGTLPLLEMLSAGQVGADLRSQGVAPVVWMLTMALGRGPFTAMGKMEGSFKQWLWEADRYQQLRKQPSSIDKRWWWEVRTRVYGQRWQQEPQAANWANQWGQAGSVRVLMAITRPQGDKGQRHPQQLPTSLLQRLPLYRWQSDWPSWEKLSVKPQCWCAVQGEHLVERLVWGPQQTDGLGHVNMNESLEAVARYGIRLLALANAPLEQLQPTGLRAFFRKPLFVGTMSQVRGELWQNKQGWMLLGGLWAGGRAGGTTAETMDESPALFCRMRWRLQL